MVEEQDAEDVFEEAEEDEEPDYDNDWNEEPEWIPEPDADEDRGSGGTVLLTGQDLRTATGWEALDRCVILCNTMRILCVCNKCV